MTLEEIQDRLVAIKAQGFIKSLRKHSTGIGKTLETLLGITENNIPLPDLGEIELKAIRTNSKNMITLFTFNKKVWKMDPLDAIKKYGKKDKNGRLGIYYTMMAKPNRSGLFFHVDDEMVEVRHIDGSIVVSWLLETIEEKFEEKVKNVLLVKANSKKIGRDEYFHFDQAKLLTGGTTKGILRNRLENKQLLIDLRLHDEVTSVRNHGTAFRVYERDIENFYEKSIEILL